MRLFAGFAKNVAFQFNVHHKPRPCGNPECKRIYKPVSKNQIMCGLERCKLWLRRQQAARVAARAVAKALNGEATR